MRCGLFSVALRLTIQPKNTAHSTEMATIQCRICVMVFSVADFAIHYAEQHLPQPAYKPRDSSFWLGQPANPDQPNVYEEEGYTSEDSEACNRAVDAQNEANKIVFANYINNRTSDKHQWVLINDGRALGEFATKEEAQLASLRFYCPLVWKTDDIRELLHPTVHFS